MNRHWFILLTALGLTLLLGACHRGSRTVTHNDSSDSLTIEEIEAYRQLAIKAENDVIRYVKADSGSWTQHEFGWWYRYHHRTDEHKEYSLLAPARAVTCPIHEVVSDLSGTLIVDAIRTFEGDSAGGVNVSPIEPIAYDMMLRELLPGDTVDLIIPWHFAYGKNGGAHVPPYTNIRTRLALHTPPYNEVEIHQDTLQTNEL